MLVGMDGTITATTVSEEDRRRAHLRVGAAAIASFVALLLLIAGLGRADAGQAVPAGAPAAIPTVPPQQSTPTDPDPGFRRHRGGFGRRGGGGDEPGFGGRGGGGGGGIPGGGDPGGGVTPAPSTGGTTT
jgi:hypothetical protein